MAPILIVIPVTTEDYETVVVNLASQFQRDGKINAACLLVFDRTTKEQESDIKGLAEKAFSSTGILRINKPSSEIWPVPKNNIWQSCARHLESIDYRKWVAWFFWDTDTVPLRTGWIDSLVQRYTEGMKPFMGNFSESKHWSTSGVYPFGISNYVVKPLLVKSVSFDDVLSQEIGLKHLNVQNDLMAINPTMYNKNGHGPSGRISIDQLEEIKSKYPKAVTFQGVSKNGDAQIEKDVSHTGTIAPIYSISVLCMNHLDLTKKCIQSILEHSRDFELFITSNGSTDGTNEWLKSLSDNPRIELVLNQKNEGFQEPNEKVLRRARGRYLVLFNNDMMACSGWLEALRKPFDQNPKMALTGIAGVCCRIDNDLRGQHGDDSKPEYIEGGCLMAPVALMRKHGLFSKYLKFIYWEDTDLGLRMRELGYDIATVPIKITHEHRSATTKTLNLEEVRKHNHEAMKSRWGFYVKRRNFERIIGVRRRGARGDVLLLTPALKALKEKWPQSKIHVETAHPEMLEGIGVHTRFIKPSWDHFYDLDSAYEKNPGIPIVEVFSQEIGVEIKSHRPVMVASDSDRAWATTVARGKNVALIHPGPTTWPGKNWPFERFVEVASFLRRKGYFTISVGNEQSPHVGCDDSVSGHCTPHQLYALCLESKIFVGLDSMPQHVASAADLPSVVLFGATNPKDIARNVPFIKTVQADRKLADCIGEHGRRTGAVAMTNCNGDCMKAVKVQDILKAIGELI